MAIEVEGTIRSTGEYADGTDALEIRIDHRYAAIIPSSSNVNVTSIDLEIDGTTYRAELRETHKTNRAPKGNKFFWINPKLVTSTLDRKKMGYVLQEAGIKRNESVILVVDNHTIVLKREAKEYYANLDRNVSRSQSDANARRSRLKSRLPFS